MKTLIATALLLATSGAYAHDSCNVNLEGGLKISKQSIEFYNKDELLYKINNDQTLIINGEALSLNASQQSLVSQYSSSIHAVVPEVQSIVMDGLDLASDGVNMAFNELLGEGNDVGRDLSEELEHIRTKLNAKFSSDEGFYINHDGIDGGDFFGEEFEQHIESVVENAVKNSMGSILIAVGQELLYSGGNTDAFEARMEGFGERIEHEMETRAETIEKRGNELCESALKINELEESMKAEIEELSDFNIISVSQSNHDEA
ncbi:DUF2884 family protein [Colwelliaceae bacterium 6471]